MKKIKVNHAIGASMTETKYDGFFDEYVLEELELSDIMDLSDRCNTPTLTLTFDTDFLRKLVKTRMIQIREIRKVVG